jgi:hypothetical protein
MPRSYCVNLKISSARWLGLGILLAALPFSAAASTTTVDFSILLNGLPGTGSFSYDASTSDFFGGYTDPSTGLETLSLTYGGNTYNLANALDSPPTVFLPGNDYGGTSNPNYGFLALWVLDGTGTCSLSTPTSYTCSGSDPGGTVTILGLGRSPQAFLDTNVGSVSFTFTPGSESEYNLGPPVVPVTTGTITSEAVVPEPTLLPLLALGLAGLWFVRRKAVV